MTELNIGGSNMDVELRAETNTIYAEANTGNKQWVAVVEDTHPKYNYDREFVAYQKPRTSDRDSGTADIEDGDVIERVRYTHSGKNRKDQFYQLVDGEAHQIDEVDVEATLQGEIVPNIDDDDDDDELHECDECGDEFASEHGLAVHEGMVHSDDEGDQEPSVDADGSDQTVVADGGETEIRDSRDVRRSDDAVRHVNNPDGTLYAYREGDEHVVVSRGDEPATRWTRRYPAERTAVAPGEHLWTIPDNWDKRVRIKTENTSYAICEIPESDVDVLVSNPDYCHLVDKWYNVRRVGQLEVTYDDEISWDDLEDTIENSRDLDEVSDETIENLEELHRRRTHFERKFAEIVDEYAEEALFRRSHGEAVVVENWTVDPWGDTFTTTDFVADFLRMDRGSDEFDDLIKSLENIHLIPSYPAVRVDVAEGKGLPEEYYLRGLMQAGCSPSEAIDYLMVEIRDQSQSDWASERGVGQSTVSRNIKDAKRTLEA